MSVPSWDRPQRIRSSEVRDSFRTIPRSELVLREPKCDVHRGFANYMFGVRRYVGTVQRAEKVASMARDRESGMTLQAIGDKHKITRERVRQLLSSTPILK